MTVNESNALWGYISDISSIFERRLSVCLSVQQVIVTDIIIRKIIRDIMCVFLWERFLSRLMSEVGEHLGGFVAVVCLEH